MPVIDVTHDVDSRSLTITAQFTAPKARVWQIYADPRQLERIWGPPECPATVVDHSFTPGGRVNYYMTGPDGEKYYGYWQIRTIDEPNGFSFDDGFADADFNPVAALPVSRNTFTFTESGGVTTARYVSVYETAEGLQKVLDMGVVEGATGSIDQIDGFLAG